MDELFQFDEPLVLEFYLGVTHCEPGRAIGCSDLNNRGLNLGYEVTVWPKTHHYRLTTGAESRGLGMPVPVVLSATEKYIAAVLGLDEFELGIFLRSWSPSETHPTRGPRPTTEKEMERALSRSL